MKSLSVTLAEIQTAKNELSKYFPPSPMQLNSWLSESLDCQVYLKLETMQPVGSFKIRGATNKIASLTPAERRRGVIAASAGNHAQGVAWGSKRLGAKALIVMPRGASLMKIANTRTLGAEVLLEGDTYDEAYAAALRIAKKTGRIFVHAFEDEHVIAGQGTTGLEILEQVPDVDAVIGSIGGGGLMAGVSIAIKELRPQVKVIGCQAKGAPAMVRAIRTGKVADPLPIDTFADGIAVQRASEHMRKLLSPRLDSVHEADDESIARAVLTLMEKAKVVSEGSGAIPLAVLEKIHAKFKRKKVVLIVSGGNIDVNLLSRIIDRGLIQAGRRIRVNVWLSDRPGSLASLTALIAKEGANVIQAIHDRSEPSTTIDLTEVALTLETRGPEHSKAVIKALSQNVLRLEFVH
jgi:threonine dehydratase